MKRLPAVLLLAITSFASLAPVVRADLTTDVRNAIKDKALARGECGVEIVKLDGTIDGKSETLFRHNSDIALIPASNLKLITTSAFLDRVGPDFKFRTTLAMRTTPSGDDLILIGDGDPSFGDAELYKKLGWDTTTVFKNWAEMLKKRGVTSVSNVLVDDSAFDANFVHKNWPVKQQHFRYVAGVGGMNFNANALDFYLQLNGNGGGVGYTIDPPTKYATVTNDCVGGNENAVWLSRTPGTNNVDLKGQTNASNREPIQVSIHDPSMFAATVLAETLQANGIKVTGKIDRDRAAKSGGGLSVLAIHETPIATVLARANKDSMNLYAEAMCKRLGAETSGTPGSWENGTAAMSAFVARAGGVTSNEYRFDDGCGLSKENGVSANAIAHVLAYDFNSKQRETFIASLSVAGTDGTLDKRFRDPHMQDLRGRVFAKSGFVNGVSALSGFVKTKDDHWYAFSILMNGVGDIATCKQIQEKIVKAIDVNATSVVGGVTSAR